MEALRNEFLWSKRQVEQNVDFFFYPSYQLDVCGVDQTQLAWRPCCETDDVFVKPGFKCFYFWWNISISPQHVLVTV